MINILDPLKDIYGEMFEAYQIAGYECKGQYKTMIQIINQHKIWEVGNNFSRLKE
jgi:hypothetical protein